MQRYLPLALSLALAACGPDTGKDGKVLDTPTTGEVTVMVDEGYKPIIASSIEVFQVTYNRAKINAIYTSEGDAVNNLLKDSVQVAVITRQLTPDELKYFKQRGFEPKTTPIAHDAVAFVVHPSNNDSVFTQAQMRDIMQGKIARWSDINPASKLGNLLMVFDNPLSGTVRYAKDSIGAGAALPANATALKTNEEVIRYVANNPGALGIIGANWISDTDDKGVQQFLRDVRLVDIAREAGAEGFGPYQAYLATGDYPYKRTVYVINAQARAGLGLGLASYLAGPDGQRIVLKDGLLPAQAPTRLIQVKRE
jgi:phosphate transport system substrate-binding protein